MVFKSRVSASGGSATSGVTSLQGEFGDITLTSSGASVIITTPSANTINLESGGTSGVTSWSGDGAILTNNASTGSVTATFGTQNKNLILAGPDRGSASSPTFRSIVGADLPYPAISSLGGIVSKSAVSHQFLTSIGTDGSIGQAQPSFSDISGSINSGQLLTITLSGDTSGSGTTAITTTLATVNTNVGTFQGLTLNAKGLVTQATNQNYLTGNQSISLSGDISGSGATSISTTLATVNTNVGSFGSSTSIPNFTVNAKGLITLAAGNAVIAPAGTVTGTTLASNVTASSLKTFGTSPSFVTPSLGTPASGVLTNCTGTASGLTAGNVTTNANLTGPVTSSGNATTLVTGIYVAASSTSALGNATLTWVMPFSGTVNTLYAQTTSGTLTWAWKINGTNITGLSAVSVSSTPSTTNATAANTFSAGDTITAVSSSASSDLGASATLKITRT